jgi:hypothetical protein
VLDCGRARAPVSFDRASGTRNCLPVKSQIANDSLSWIDVQYPLVNRPRYRCGSTARAVKLGHKWKQGFVGRLATVVQNSVHTSQLSADWGMESLREEAQNTQVTDPT